MVKPSMENTNNSLKIWNCTVIVRDQVQSFFRQSPHYYALFSRLSSEHLLVEVIDYKFNLVRAIFWGNWVIQSPAPDPRLP